MRTLFSLIPLVSSLTRPCAGSEAPEQVHLALGKTQDSMSVAWVTGVDLPSMVEWGESQSSHLSFQAISDRRVFKADAGRIWFTHVATMFGLKTNTSYKYRVTVGDTHTETFSFMNRRSGSPYRHVIFGDLGSSHAFSLCSACSADTEVCNSKTCAADVSAGLVSEVGKADLFVHLGDFGYDLENNNGTTGDQFMRNIEQLAASVPYMVNHGNHEHGLSLVHYIERFRSQPSNAVPGTFTTINGETTNSLYFSWDFGLVHYVSFSTELWFGVSDGRTTKASFIDWLRQDLSAANHNREASPWVVVTAHRSIYCSCDTDCDSDASIVRNDLEDMFMDYGVDLFLNAHEHNYERTFPIYQGKSAFSSVNPKAPIYIVSGCAGNQEMHEPFMRFQPSWSAFRSNTFSYSVLTTYNSTHALWQQISTDPTSFPLVEYGKVIDQVWIVQYSHGPFNREEAPKGKTFNVNCRNSSLDHWLPLLDIEDDSKSSSDYVISRFRATHGEKSWKQRMERIAQWGRSKFGPTFKWRRSGLSQSESALYVTDFV